MAEPMTPRERAELLPCPWCAGKPQVRDDWPAESVEFRWVAWCDWSNACAAHPAVKASSRKEAITAWNRRATRSPEAAGEAIDIVFDGPPGPEAGRFVEVESPPGIGIKFGEWLQRPDGYWVLRFQAPLPRPSRRGRDLVTDSDGVPAAAPQGGPQEPQGSDTAKRALGALPQPEASADLSLMRNTLQRLNEGALAIRVSAEHYRWLAQRVDAIVADFEALPNAKLGFYTIGYLTTRIREGCQNGRPIKDADRERRVRALNVAREGG